jgi:hypothetical protein
VNSHHNEAIELEKLLLARVFVAVGQEAAPYVARLPKKATSELSLEAKLALWNAAAALLLENSSFIDNSSSGEEAA